MKKIMLALLGIVLILSGCSNPGPGVSQIGIVGRIIYDDLFGEDITIAVLENATIYGESTYMGTLVSDAIVTINDIELPFDASWGYIDDGALITLTPGNSYTVKVVYNGKTFEQTLIMPPAPSITSHIDGNTWDETILTDLDWSLLTVTHDENQIFIASYDTQSGDDYSLTLPAASLTFGIPANTLLANDAFPFGVEINVRARTKLPDLGADYTTGSYILLENEGSVSVDTSL